MELEVSVSQLLGRYTVKMRNTGVEVRTHLCLQEPKDKGPGCLRRSSLGGPGIEIWQHGQWQVGWTRDARCGHTNPYIGCEGNS